MAKRRNNRKTHVSPIYTFALTWLLLAGVFSLYRLGSLMAVLLICTGAAFLAGKIADSRDKKTEERQQEAVRRGAAIRKTDSQGPSVRKTDVPPEAAAPAKKSYGPEIDPILEEGNRALSEMGRLYMSIKDPEIRQKINEIMRITDKITQDAIQDPSDIPQIKKFMNYYLPTTIKLLNAYDRMSAQGIEGENLNKSMSSINEMLDAAIVAYKKRLDSLFANQALDIETDIEVMNRMLAREGLIGEKDFQVSQTAGT